VASEAEIPTSQPSPSAATTGAPPGDGPESVGRYLSRQRRLRGISLDELAQMTRIPIRSLERLESGRFDGEADGFVRGFVRTVGQALGLDPEDTVARLLSEVQIERESGAHHVSLRRTLLAVALVVVFAALLGLGRWFIGVLAGDGGAEVQIVYRQDPVRALADAVAAQGGASDGAAAPTVPAPPAPRSAARRTAEALAP